ncbi:uncharacterized protein LOC124368669 [Homalodisca vitripennis]|uniref:uncharacterized protein LOC124368669 n=1 Tax=Homalodisca vitripennis TaxID=197043 RepID=UPI001EEB8E33|nr:uncharacterized protein LOC124368669 [Homalodisca vitripennis]
MEIEKPTVEAPVTGRALGIVLFTLAQFTWVYLMQGSRQMQEEGPVCNTVGQPCDSVQVTCCWPAYCNISGETGLFGLCLEEENNSKLRPYFSKIGEKIKNSVEAFNNFVKYCRST